MTVEENVKKKLGSLHQIQIHQILANIGWQMREEVEVSEPAEEEIPYISLGLKISGQKMELFVPDDLAQAQQSSSAMNPADQITELTMRTHYCGALTASDIGRTVTVCGWVARRREHGEHLAFVDLRDHTGVVQIVVDNAHDLRSEFVLAVTGMVRERPEGTINAELATGEIEIGDAEIEVLATATPPPFMAEAGTDIDESLRIRHRYLDLRSDRMQSNLRRRARINAAIRQAMDGQGFTEIETPILMASTPEGARDFVVPSRLHQGSFYALPQSPQLFKQLCMVGGLDRYYQIARCLRDEDLRADRQFEFSQLDLEMSFADGAAVRAVVANAMVAAATAAAADPAATPTAADFGLAEIPEITWYEAMNRFGSDKPDMRYGSELTDLTTVFTKTEFNAFKTPCVKAILVPGGADVSRNVVDQLTDNAKSWGAKGLVWMRVESVDGSLTVNSPVAKFMSEAEIAGVLTGLDAAPGDMCYLVADEWRQCCHVLGLLRQHFGQELAQSGQLGDEYKFVWVVDFPLFEEISAQGAPVPAHHPFTMPVAQDLEKITAASELRKAGQPLGEDVLAGLLEVRSQAYDLVLNGWELGSGSVRIFSHDIQQQLFDVLGIAPEIAQERFGFLLTAFEYGAPPHAGFAVGIDRLAALLCGEDSIREVIAFPKTQSGADPLTGAPSTLSPRHLTELGLRLTPEMPAN